MHDTDVLRHLVSSFIKDNNKGQLNNKNDLYISDFYVEQTSY